MTLKKLDLSKDPAKKKDPTPKKTPAVKNVETLSDIKAKVEDAIRAELAGCNEIVIKRLVHDTVANHAKTIVGKLLGFDNRWGRWELDHCNGSGGESAAGDFIRSVAQSEIKEWLTKMSGKLPELSNEVVKDLRKFYLETLQRELRTILDRKAIEEAERQVDTILAGCTERELDE